MKKLVISLVVISFVCAGAAQAITVGNFSFEEPGTVKMGNWTDVPDWSSDTVASDSGVELGGSPGNGDWNGYLMVGGDPPVWQLTGCEVAEGDVFALTIDAGIGWMDGPDSIVGSTSTLNMKLYYYDDNDERSPIKNRDVVITTDSIGPNWGGVFSGWDEYTLNVDIDSECPEAVGHNIGIEFLGVSHEGSGGCWMGIDDVRLVPEPATMMLLGLGSLALLKRRRA